MVVAIAKLRFGSQLIFDPLDHPIGFRSGDFVQAEKAGQVYRGRSGGYTETTKLKLKRCRLMTLTGKELGSSAPITSSYSSALLSYRLVEPHPERHSCHCQASGDDEGLLAVEVE